MKKVIPQKHFTHDYTNEYKSLQGIFFAQETAAILSNMVSRSKQTNLRDIPSYGRDKDNSLYQRYVGYYNYYFDATSLSFTVFVLMINSLIFFSNTPSTTGTGRLSGGGTQNPGTRGNLSGRT